jgi:ubiquinone/menaquinone biosynthesis C-methylase UbiE
MPAYSEESYWEERYSSEPGAYDWYQGYHGLKELLSTLIPTTSRILQVGVGTSRLQEHMVRIGGYKNITNLDFSKVVIKQMSELHKSVPELKYLVADCRNMPDVEDCSFDVVLDKGTFDAMICGESSLNSSLQMLQECHRVLVPGGTMLIVTYGEPVSRLHYFLDSKYPHWEDVQVYCIAKLEQLISAAGASQRDCPIDEVSLPPVLKGPYHCTNLDAMDALSELEAVHYVYVLKKNFYKLGD